MNIKLHEGDPIEVLSSINYIDSALFGLSIDLFKIRLFIDAQESSRLMSYGFDEGYAHLCFEFRLIENLKVDLNRSLFAPPYLEDGDLSAADLFDFDFEILDIKKVGKTGRANRYDEYSEFRDIYEVRFTFRNGLLQFQFVNLEVFTFDPLDLDKKDYLNSERDVNQNT